MCGTTRIDAHPASETTVHLEFRDVPFRYTPNETNRDSDNNVALSTRASAPRPQRRLRPTARTCVPIHYPNWLIEISRHWRGTDGYSFVRSGTYQGERTRPFDLIRSLRHIRRAQTYAFRQCARTTVRRGSQACHLILWLTPARLIVSAVEGRLDARCVFVRTAVEMLKEKDFCDDPLSTPV